MHYTAKQVYVVAALLDDNHIVMAGGVVDRTVFEGTWLTLQYRHQQDRVLCTGTVK